MPVLPEVGSTRMDSGFSLPLASSASIMATPIRSFTEAIGLKNSILPMMSASTPCARASLDRRTNGVLPTVWVMLS